MSRRYRINYAQPINWRHPLARGLVSRWLIMPWYKSGPRLIDLAGRNHGTLTNGPAWQGTQRPGGWGTLSFDGVDDYVTVPAFSTRISGAAQLSMGGWVKTPASVGSNGQACFGIRADADAAGAFYVNLLNTGNVEARFRNGSGTATTLNAAWTASAWNHFVLTYDGSTLRLYVNGALGASGAASGTLGVNGLEFSLGHTFFQSDFPAWFSGLQDGPWFMTRGLSASEVALDYQMSRRGYPGLINRLIMKPYTGQLVPDDFSRAKRYTFPPQENEFIFPAQENEFAFPPQESEFVFPPE